MTLYEAANNLMDTLVSSGLGGRDGPISDAIRAMNIALTSTSAWLPEPDGEGDWWWKKTRASKPIYVELKRGKSGQLWDETHSFDYPANDMGGFWQHVQPAVEGDK